MADYNKQTVAQLRQLLKDRGIPSTGLTRKAQIVEKLEEADSTGTEAPGANNATEETAPSPQESEQAEEQSPQMEAVPGPPLAEAGEPTRTAAEVEAIAEPTPVPAPTADRSPETISHIESDVPPPSETKAIEHSAEDTTMEEEVGGLQPTQIFSAAPAAPEDDQVGPHITEPTDEEAEAEAEDGKTEVAKDELPEAPGPAAEALRLAQTAPAASKELQDTAMEIETPPPAANERATVEKPELLPIPERSTAETSRLNTEELEADTRKRKRRSNSPDLTAKEISAKKPRPSQEPAPDVHLREDDDVVMDQAAPPSPKREKKENADRYKDLLQPASDLPRDALNDDRPTIPAIHPVTSALYIRNFMRPLRPEPLRAHLTTLATPPSSSPDPSILTALFLDNMKTHALALFTSPTAASRVRASLHGTIWPPEANRKELWVDFVPDTSVQDWIKTEEDALAAEKAARAAGRPAPGTRFEVVYSETAGGIVAEHRALSAGAATTASAPSGPHDSTTARRLSTNPAPPTEDTSAPFKTLHDLFPSTLAKPSLFFLPVPDAVSDARLAALAADTSRDWDPGAVRKGRGIRIESQYRYTFDTEGMVVEGGEEGRRGGFRGGFRGRGRGGGGGGGGWRG